MDLTAAAQLIVEYNADAPTLAILKHTNPCGLGQDDKLVEAWEKARSLTLLNDINPEREPRIRTLTGDVALKTDHPYFWSGYLLVDTGVEPVREAPAEVGKPEDEKK